MDNGATGSTSPWFDFGNKPRRQDVELRLFCFPYAGAGASMFRLWQDWLPDQVELVAVQLPGREDRLDEPLMQSMEAMTTAMADAMPPFLDKPFAFFGHSTGAMICFELARVLRQRSLAQPRLLILSAQNGPGEKPAVLRHRLSNSEFINVIRKCEGTPEIVLQNPELLEMLLPRIRADGAVYETYCYAPQRPLDCRIAVFYGRDDAMVSLDGLAGWAAEAKHGFKCYDGFPGGHFFIHEAAESMAGHINKELEPLLPRQADRHKDLNYGEVAIG